MRHILDWASNAVRTLGTRALWSELHFKWPLYAFRQSEGHQQIHPIRYLHVRTIPAGIPVGPRTLIDIVSCTERPSTHHSCTIHQHTCTAFYAKTPRLQLLEQTSTPKKPLFNPFLKFKSPADSDNQRPIATGLGSPWQPAIMRLTQVIPTQTPSDRAPNKRQYYLLPNYRK